MRLHTEPQQPPFNVCSYAAEGACAAVCAADRFLCSQAMCLQQRDACEPLPACCGMWTWQQCAEGWRGVRMLGIEL